MTLRGAVLAGRRAAEAMQTDTCLITRPGTGEGTFDPETGTTTPPEPVAVYGTEAVPGKCRLRVPTLGDREQMSGEYQWTTQDAVLSLPIAATGVRVGDGVLLVASELDPDLPGRRYEVKAVLRGSQTTARRLVVREAS